jgi:putative endonuclease
MAIHIETGRLGESLATAHLIEKGYKILETNFRFNKAEIDIIAEIGRYIVFIEVKTRTSDFDLPEKAVTKKKQALIHKASNEFLYRNKIDKNVRFDIISIFIWPEKTKIYHMEDVFFPKLN